MRLRPLFFAIMAFSASLQAQESPNIIRIPASIGLSDNDRSFWQQIDSYTSDWKTVRGDYACTDWTPDPSTQVIGAAFLQTQSCRQDQERKIQQRQQNSKTQEIRNLGSAHTENQTLESSNTRESVGALETWIAATPAYTEWESISGAHDCSNWSPNPSGYTQSTSFNQKSTNCVIDQSRTRQEREQETTTGDIRNSGSPVAESRLLPGQTATRPYVIAISEWANQGNKKSCSNWAPATTTVGLGKPFTQTATDCKQDQTRTRNEQYTDHLSGQKVVALNKTESQTIAVSDTRDSVGSLEAWIAASSTYTDWSTTKGPYSCGSWAPGGYGYTSTASFTQSSSTCALDQTRSRQDREQEANTGNYRDKGSVVAEMRTLNNQTATRPYQVTLGAWTNNGAVTSCSNWSPAPSTITTGTSFTQTATDCAQAQLRSRVEQYTDNETGKTVVAVSTNESRSITATSTRTSTGSKETWAATTSTYTGWVNSGAATSCSNWSPATSTVTVGQSFTQTANDCNQAQTRTRQDREQETTTGAIRNKGAAVTETQSITASSTRTATGTKETWAATTSTYTGWVNSGAATSCSNWSPATSTVNVGQSFTQTANDCKQAQSRTRQDREQETTTGAIRNKGAAVTETQSITASSTRTATGTKETWVAAVSTYGAWTNSGSLYSCSNWTPAGSGYTSSASFTQTATNCSMNQTRTAQAREQETTTGAFRNVGSATNESRTLASQTATRAYTVTLGAWQNSGAVASCSNWSPDPSTVNSGTSFTQTATNCTQSQVRSRVEKYNDHATGVLTTAVNTSQSQSIAASSTRSAIGTKAVKTCTYITNKDYVQIKGSTSTYYSAGASLGSNSGTTLNVGAYQYSAGALMKPNDRGDYYEICSIPL